MAADILVDVEAWYESKRHRTGTVNTNVMTVGLILTEHMAAGVPLRKATYLSSSQVSGLSGPKIQSILAAHGEERHFTSEGGRTSRKSRPFAEELAPILSRSAQAAGYRDLTTLQKRRVRTTLQRWFVEKVRTDYFDRQRITAEIDPGLPGRAAIAGLLTSARERTGNVAGAVAQHLVGAKLCLRFPDLEIANNGYTTADQQTDRAGDFTVGDTAIHVTIAPSEALFRKCRRNLVDGYRALVLVPERRVQGARELAENAGLGARLSVQAIEDYVGNNVEEIGGLSSNGIRDGLRALLEKYNERVQEIETDPSLQIEVPTNL